MSSLYRYLDTNGDGTGTKNANGDYSSTPEVFYIQPPAGYSYRLCRLMILIEDAKGFQAGNYGSLAGALSNGVTIQTLNNDGVTCDITDGIAITHNAHYAILAYEVDLKVWGSGEDALVVRFCLNGIEKPIIIDGDHSGRLEVQLNDNFTGISEHYFMVHGEILKNQ